MTTSTPSELVTTLRFWTWTVAATEASIEDCSAPRCGAPPMWKVRIVSWVPGSPIDCAAMTPTASPALTGVPRARGAEERRVGKACVSTWRSRWTRCHSKNTKTQDEQIYQYKGQKQQ